MKRLAAGAVLSLIFTASVYASGAAPPPQPRRDILGIRVGMSAEEARSQLQKIGRRLREERKRQEIWEVTDPYFAHLVIQLDKANQVHFVTAYAHDEKAARERMRYGDVGELKKARQTGEIARKNYRYQWQLEAAGRNPKINIVAWGRDPQYLQYYSIERAN